ncbi:hypothetical protein C7999DRAFT_15175 [Corynascus novoguineensis]|uniref:tRNA-intron lyase n=1 Tax=Corynascus novoguineensis TaxID=1126955 RepID=A0AAN7HIE5_9PEZI|nr:hypothetical protein C7999DRAFT_15175 [Corynascus novoguineensis]
MAAANGASAKISEGAPTGNVPSTGAAGERASLSRPALHQIYALPAPIQTFPLPTFYPNNPISIFHLVYTWLSQVLRPPSLEPSVVHTGVWDPETRSVHVRDEASIRALWEQGFYGKGSLSRSEPNWLKRELARRGSPEGKTVSEARTELRREERRLAKWERAKAELEAIERQRLAEAASHAAASRPSKLDEVVSKPAEVLDALALPDPVHSAAVKPAEVVAEILAETAPAKGLQSCQIDAQLRGYHQVGKPPVGPAELLALPNSLAELKSLGSSLVTDQQQSVEPKPPVGPAELLLLPNSIAELVERASRPTSGLAVLELGKSTLNQPLLPANPVVNGGTESSDDPHDTVGVAGWNASKSSASAANQQVEKIILNGTSVNGHAKEPGSSPSLRSNEPALSSSALGLESDVSQLKKRRKSVRFSPTVESATFVHSDPPSPNRSAGLSSKSVTMALPNDKAIEPEASPAATPAQPDRGNSFNPAPDVSADVVNKERFQLAPEEAFFLVFSLGALKVVDPVTGSPIPTEHLLALLRSYSYFPPQIDGSALRPDDPFLVNYAVYHHFRSLGWVPRHGIKFGVDWIIYQRGPVFDHSEFGIMVMPAYSDPAWEEHEHEEPKRSWSWLMGVNRVLSHVLKSLVLVYVDLPPPALFEKEMQRGGIAAALKKYKIREVMVRRFSVNRNR